MTLLEVMRTDADHVRENLIVGRRALATLFAWITFARSSDLVEMTEASSVLRDYNASEGIAYAIVGEGS